MLALRLRNSEWPLETLSIASLDPTLLILHSDCVFLLQVAVHEYRKKTLTEVPVIFDAHELFLP